MVNRAIFFKMKKFGLSKDDIARIKEVFEKYAQLEEVLIYGSRAMGTYKPASDIDITLKGKDIDFDVQQQIEFDLDDLLLPYKFDISIHDKINHPEFLDYIERVGKKFYKKKRPQNQDVGNSTT